MGVKVLVSQSCAALCELMDCNLPGCSICRILQARIWLGSHSILQGIFLIQGRNLDTLHCRHILYRLSHQGSTPGIIQFMSELSRPESLHLLQSVQFSSVVTQSCPILCDPKNRNTPAYTWLNAFHIPSSSDPFVANAGSHLFSGSCSQIPKSKTFPTILPYLKSNIRLFWNIFFQTNSLLSEPNLTYDRG